MQTIVENYCHASTKSSALLRERQSPDFMREILPTLAILAACSTPKKVAVPQQTQFQSAFELLEYAKQWNDADEAPKNLDELLEKSVHYCTKGEKLEQAYGCHAVAEYLVVGGSDINDVLAPANKLWKQEMGAKETVDTVNIVSTFAVIKMSYTQEGCNDNIKKHLRNVYDPLIQKRLLLTSVSDYTQKAIDIYMKHHPVNEIQLITRAYEVAAQANFASQNLGIVQAQIDQLRRSEKCSNYVRFK